MKIIKQSVELVNPIPYKDMLNTVELATRNCYNSYDKMTDNSAEGLIRGCIKSGHLSVTEFGDITVRLITSRSVLAQLSRHRLASMAVQSQRYVKYDDVEFVEPYDLNNEAYDNWKAACKTAEAAYKVMLYDCGMKAEIARSVLPNCTSTVIFMKANIREWRHILSLRCDKRAQTEIRMLMAQTLEKLYQQYPVFFEDLYNRYVLLVTDTEVHKEDG